MVAGVALLLASIFAGNANAIPISAAGSPLKQAAPQSGVTKA
jgi:hypothetical protein